MDSNPNCPQPLWEGSEPQKLFVNRELSWLEFNKRVLLESLDESVPLLERLKFAAIYASNLDEFFMVRVGTLSDQSLVEPEKLDDKTGMTADEQIAAVFERVRSYLPLCKQSYDTLRRQLRLADVDILHFKKMSKVEELIVQKIFDEEIKPLLSPQIVDRHHPFPFLKNKEQYVATSFTTKNEDIKLGIVPISHLPLYYIFSIDNRRKVAFTADIVRHNVQHLYSKYTIEERLVMRVTRNADITVDEGLFDFDVDFRDMMQELLKKRKRLSIVRLELSHEPGEKLRNYLCQKMYIKPEWILVHDIPQDFSFGFTLGKDLNLPDKRLVYSELKPFVPVDFTHKNAIHTISEHDLLLAYPFHSMKPMIDLLYEAANDPTVISIKMSLYRLANHSRIVSALAQAAEKGKEVICVLELRARFDEQSNIDYAKVLEDAGCTVLYGLPDYKVHAKLCLITRKQHNKISYITQVGTGNYNEKTSELYTDLALFTADERVGLDANEVFNALCMGDVVETTRSLWVAPNCFLSNLLELIQRETEVQRAGGAGYICMKVNSLNDLEVMQRLIEASQAGVQIELFIRGICCLRPGVEGYTENITIKSIVGRHLEHSRIFVFGSGDREVIYIGSGDLLNRNTRRRVEVFARVTSPQVRQDVLHILDSFRRDNVKSWTMLPDGSYHKPVRSPDDEVLDSQMELHEYFSKPLAPPVKPGAFRGLRGWWRRTFH